MPIPTTSPAWTLAESQGSSVSSVITGSPYDSGVAAASTYNHRGVITPTPKARPLGLMRCTFIQSPVSNRYASTLGGPIVPQIKEDTDPENGKVTAALFRALYRARLPARLRRGVLDANTRRRSRSGRAARSPNSAPARSLAARGGPPCRGFVRHRGRPSRGTGVLPQSSGSF